MAHPELPSSAPERIDDDARSFNERIAKLAAHPAFGADHLAREETAIVLDQLHEDVDSNTQGVYSDIHKFLPELAEPVRLHDGDMVLGLEYNNGSLSFHGQRYGALDGKHLPVQLRGHERRSGTVITSDGKVQPYTLEGNNDAEQSDDFPLFPSETEPPLPPLYAAGGLPGV